MKYSKLFSILLLLITIEFNAQTWVTKATNFPAANTQVEQIAIANDNVVWSCKGRSNVFSKSVDGGNTWTTGAINIGTNTFISSITAVSALKAWVCTYDSDLGVFATVDGGLTWTKQPTAYNQSVYSFPNFIKFFDENNGITGGDPIDDNFEIYTTSNGGVNWTRVPTTNLPPLINGEYGLTNYFDATQDGSSIWFGSKYGTESRLFKSNNNGQNWTVTTLTINGGSYGLTFKDANVGFVYGKVNNVFSLQKTTDGGNTFTNIPTSGLSGDVTNIKCVPNNNMIVASTLTNGLSYCNYFPSETTIAFQSFTNQIFSSTFEFKNFYTGYAAGTNTNTTNGIYKFNNTISLIGSTIGTPWTTDLDFITTDGFNYTLSNYSFTNGLAIFRQNHTWNPYALDWSSNDFPSGVGVLNGTEIPVSMGTYTVNFNIATLEFSFVPSLSNPIFTNKKFALYPNPASSILKIQMDENKTADKIIITDLSGKKMLEQNNTTQVDVQNLAKGMYVIETVSGEDKFVNKFLKE